MTTMPPAEIGMALEDVDTPALLLDLDAFERNLDRMAKAIEGKPVKLRPHSKSHKCAVIGLAQMVFSWVADFVPGRGAARGGLRRLWLIVQRRRTWVSWRQIGRAHV